MICKHCEKESIITMPTKEENFTLRGVLLWTVNDFPTYGNLSRCCEKML